MRRVAAQRFSNYETAAILRDAAFGGSGWGGGATYCLPRRQPGLRSAPSGLLAKAIFSIDSESAQSSVCFASERKVARIVAVNCAPAFGKASMLQITVII